MLSEKSQESTKLSKDLPKFMMLFYDVYTTLSGYEKSIIQLTNKYSLWNKAK